VSISDSHGIKKTSGKENQTDSSAQAERAALGRHKEILAQARTLPQDTRDKEALETGKI
jgi:hypothetical protein